VLEEWAFPTGWEEWQPDGRIAPLTLPEDWHVV
jgi:hypothetical protein